MRVVVDKAQSRGYANHGWLKTHHTFSFANYYNPERVHFGMLRVLNDDSAARVARPPVPWRRVRDSICIHIRIWRLSPSR